MILDWICFIGYINWEAWAAIGQIGGAIATFWAVVVALRSRKPKVLIRTHISYFNQFDANGLARTYKMLNLEAINQGSVNLNITKCELDLGSAGRIILADGNEGKGELLSPDKPVIRSIRSELVTAHFNRVGISGQERIKVIFSNNHGNEYIKRFVYRIGLPDEISDIQD